MDRGIAFAERPLRMCCVNSVDFWNTLLTAGRSPGPLRGTFTAENFSTPLLNRQVRANSRLIDDLVNEVQLIDLPKSTPIFGWIAK
jgi:hypothetical protein